MRGVRTTIAVSILAAAVSSAGVAPSAETEHGALVRPPAPAATLSLLAEAVGGRGASENVARTAYLQKLDSHLQDVAASRLAGTAADTRTAALRQGVTLSAGGDALVDVYVDGDVSQAAARLRALGMHVTATSERNPQRLVEGLLPPAALPAAAQLAETSAIVSSLSDANTGSVLSEGDAAIHGPQARALGANGAGVLVGIISDSINQAGTKIAGSQASGNLPANVQVLLDQPGGDDEGRAMAEIVYDEAPGISGIVYSSGTTGSAAKAASIDNLVAAGAKVIADDIAWFDQPFFQDGIITQAVDRAKAAGTAYFTSAGNYGTDSWEGAYNGGASEDFDPGPGADTVQTLGMIPSMSSGRIDLQWAEPWGHAASDFAIDVYAISGGTPSFAFTIDTNNLVSGLPDEFSVIANNGGSTITVGIAIRRVAGTGAPLLKYILFGDVTANIQFPTNSSAIAPDAAAANGALTVAASEYTTPTTPETFSSRGPVTHYFDANGAALAAPEVRQKPNLDSTDGVSTSVGGDFDPFFGTSAAAPSAAGIAALIRSAKPAMSVNELYAIMTSASNALDCPATPGTPDIACGIGFVLADRALAMALDPTPPLITPVITPAVPDGANGWYRGAATVTWTVSDPESPVVDVAPACAPATPGEGSGALTCSAASAGGVTSIPLTFKRDATAPSAPTFDGIKAKTYLSTALPKTSAIACSAVDAVSGITSCTVSGFKTGVGAHVLTAVATNGAGLTTSSTLTYRIAKPAAISKLTLAKGLTLSKLSASGLALTTRVAAKSTRLTAKLTARIPKAGGSGTVSIVLAALSVKAKPGTVHLRLKLTAAAKLELSVVTKAQLALTISGSSSLSQAVKLQRSFVVRR